MNKGGNKLALAIRLIGESTLEIEFMHWDSRFLSNYNNENVDDDKFVYFESEDRQFCIYSHEDGYILDINEKTSMIKWLTDQGYTVFVISWINPGKSHADKSASKAHKGLKTGGVIEKYATGGVIQKYKTGGKMKKAYGGAC